MKVFFAISYLKKSALEWFENGIMEQNQLQVLPTMHICVQSIPVKDLPPRVPVVLVT